MEKTILDELYEMGSEGKVYLGYAQVTDHTHMIDKVTSTHWQPSPSRLHESKRWVDSYETQKNCLIDAQGVISVTVAHVASKDKYQKTWSEYHA
ncbi:hypothetical protein [Kocuria marina]|uniref:hypothetical protein n=1 Tax=Kocuria marina TaxID=223184 RepID=UPI003F28B41D